MINYGKYLERFKKLNWVDDETLLNAENLNRLEEFIDILDLRTRSEVGDVIESAVYKDMNQVIDRYGGKYWILIDKPNSVYNRWLRSDVDPTTVKQVSYKGMVFITVKGVFLNADAVKEEYGGISWNKVNAPESAFDIWMCTEHEASTEMVSLKSLPVRFISSAMAVKSITIVSLAISFTPNRLFETKAFAST